MTIRACATWAACVLLGACAGAHPLLRITAGAATPTASGLMGSFVVARSAGSGIASAGTGGACLVFSEQPDGRADCGVDDDCALEPRYAGGHAYCLHAAGIPRLPGRCWIRPPGNYCLRSPSRPYPPGRTVVFPLDAEGQRQPVRAMSGWWRVHACLAGRAPAACGDETDADKQFDDGPPVRVE